MSENEKTETILTREEFVEHFSAIEWGPSHVTRILAHDAALRAEVERLTQERDEANGSGRSTERVGDMVISVLKQFRDRVATLEAAIRDAPHEPHCPRFSTASQIPDHLIPPCSCWRRTVLERTP